MDAVEIDETLWRMADLLGEHYDPAEFWFWLDQVKQNHYDEGYQQGRADALGAL